MTPLRRPPLAFALAALLALASAACTEDGATSPFADVAGTYDVVSVNGAVLPARLSTGEYLTRGTLDLIDDGRAILGVFTQAEQTGPTPTFPQFLKLETTYTRRDTTIVFASRSGIYFENGTGRFTAPGRLAVSTVHVTATGASTNPVTIVYQRRGT
jgi:hypothetical protein